MRRLALITLLALLATGLAAQSSFTTEVRGAPTQALDDISGPEARSFAHRGNAARAMIDRTDLSDRPERSDQTHITRPLPTRMTSSFDPRDQLVLFEINRLNLRGGEVPRYLRLSIRLNVGQDSALLARLTGAETPAIVSDNLEDMFGGLSFDDVRTPSQKNDLRERMIIRFNELFETNSIKDLYYATFVVF